MAFKINIQRYPFMKNMNAEKFSESIALTSGVIKLVCGVTNNLAYLLMHDARDKMRKHPAYRHNVKRAYNQTFVEYDAYRRALLFPPSDRPRFFHLDDLDAATRKKFGDITDEQYFEFWEGCAGRAYAGEYRPYITSLANKYRLSLVHHGIPHADILQWPMVTEAVLELAVTLHDTVLDEMSEQYNLPKKMLAHLLGPFSLARVAAAWKRALDVTEPKTNDYVLEPGEERNIELGLEQLTEILSKPEHFYDSVLTSVQEYDEIFRTAGEQKKIIREIEAMTIPRS